MSFVKWSDPGPVVTYLSTELNGLGAGSRAIGAAIANSVANDRWADLELVANIGLTGQSNLFASLYIIPSLDGTNYSDGDASVQPPETMLVGIFPLRDNATSRVALRGVALPPTDFKFLLRNDSGTPFAASGNTLRYRTYNEEIV